MKENFKLNLKGTYIYNYTTLKKSESLNILMKVYYQVSRLKK